MTKRKTKSKTTATVTKKKSIKPAIVKSKKPKQVKRVKRSSSIKRKKPISRGIKQLRKKVILLASFIMLSFIVACMVIMANRSNDEVSVLGIFSSISLNYSGTIERKANGAGEIFEATVKQGLTISGWSNSNPSVASCGVGSTGIYYNCSSTGTIGTTTITATASNGKTASVKLKFVPKITIGNSKFNSSNSTITEYTGNIRAYFQLFYFVSPRSESESVTWKSSNNLIVKFESKAKDDLCMTAFFSVKKAGDVVLTGTSKSGAEVKVNLKIIESDIAIKRLKSYVVSDGFDSTVINRDVLNNVDRNFYAKTIKSSDTVTWTTSNSSIARILVSNYDNKIASINEVGIGTATIRATSSRGASTEFNIKVDDGDGSSKYKVSPKNGYLNSTQLPSNIKTASARTERYCNYDRSWEYKYYFEAWAPAYLYKDLKEVRFFKSSSMSDDGGLGLAVQDYVVIACNEPKFGPGVLIHEAAHIWDFNYNKPNLKHIRISDQSDFSAKYDKYKRLRDNGKIYFGNLDYYSNHTEFLATVYTAYFDNYIHSLDNESIYGTPSDFPCDIKDLIEKYTGVKSSEKKCKTVW